MAQSVGLDLVEVSPGDVPVCKALDYAQFRYRQNKKSTSKTKNQKRTQVKKIKFRPVTDIGDFNVKVKKIQSFLEAGHRVELSVRFKGREITHQDLGFDILKRAKEAVVDFGDVEQEPKMEGRQVMMLIFPKKQKT